VWFANAHGFAEGSRRSANKQTIMVADLIVEKLIFRLEFVAVESCLVFHFRAPLGSEY
jgi:hypothetical protein